MNEKFTIEHKGFTSYEKQYDIVDRQFITFSLFIKGSPCKSCPAFCIKFLLYSLKGSYHAVYLIISTLYYFSKNICTKKSTFIYLFFLRDFCMSSEECKIHHILTQKCLFGCLTQVFFIQCMIS